jgi:hypothetical protein
MEISGRLQVAKCASMSVIQSNSKTHDVVDETGWALKKDRCVYSVVCVRVRCVCLMMVLFWFRILARSIMRKPQTKSVEVQVQGEDIDEENNPFHEHRDMSSRKPRDVKSAQSLGKAGHTAKAKHGNMSPFQASHRSPPRSPFGHKHAYGQSLGVQSVPATNHVLQLKVSALHLLHQMVGLDDNRLCNALTHKMPAALMVDLCRVFVVDEPAKELEPFHNASHEKEVRISIDESADKSIAGETARRKQYVHVNDVSTSSLFNAAVDIGPAALRQAKWVQGSLIGLPIASHSGYLELVLILGRISMPFSEEEIEAISWMAVTLSSVLHHNKHLATRESQIHLMDTVTENAVHLARQGCEVQDPRFWMQAFDAQVAQIALVHRDAQSGRLLLYCNSSDTSKEEVSMTCFPPR